MKNTFGNKISTALLSGLLIASLTGCAATAGITAKAEDTAAPAAAEVTETPAAAVTEEKTSTPQTTVTENTESTAETASADYGDAFTDRDLKQTADLSGAQTITVKSGEDVSITAEGVYVISGTAEDVTVRVEADDQAKVQLVLDGLQVTNTDSPVIYVVSADKVFVTTADSENTLTVSGTFTADGETNTDAVIFAKDDLVLNGTGTLNISSTDNGITCKDDLKITGGTIVIDSVSDAIEANDSINIADGNVTITSDKDGIHCENDEDNTVGEINIYGGTFNITAADDGIQGTTYVRIYDGTFTINAAEGIEGTYVQINDGTVSISASDDGINASYKSTAVPVILEINGGDITVVMAAGDTDALDSNGKLIVNGGNINITAQFAFDFDGGSEFNGGTIIVNGSEVTSISNSMMGVGMFGGQGMMPGGQDQMPDGTGQMPGQGQMPGWGGQGGFGGHGKGN